jgi:hypothetical protein
MSRPDLKMSDIFVRPCAPGTEVPTFRGSVTPVPAGSLQPVTHPSRQIGPLR